MTCGPSWTRPPKTPNRSDRSGGRDTFLALAVLLREFCQFPGNPVERALPIPPALLAEDAHRGIPGAIQAIEQPAPLGCIRQRDPNGHAQRASQILQLVFIPRSQRARLFDAHGRPVYDSYLYWHANADGDPSNAWLRGELVRAAVPRGSTQRLR